MIPSNAKRIPLRPLALGEATGHHHSLYVEHGVCLDDVAEMYEVTDDSGTRVFLRITQDGVVSIQHQEHKTALLPGGEYEVVIQQEVTDWGQSPVID